MFVSESIIVFGRIGTWANRCFLMMRDVETTIKIVGIIISAMAETEY